MTPQRIIAARLIGSAMIIAALVLAPTPAPAQVTPAFATEGEPPEEGIELLQSEPFDLVRFKESAGGGWVKVRPLDLPNRRVPENPTGTLTMNVLGLPGATYEAKWGDIERIELWEQRLAEEAESRMAAGDFSGAFPFLAVLYRENPGVANVEEMRREYLYNNAAAEFRQGDLKKTLAMLEELRAVAPEYRPEQVLRIIGGITDRLMESMMASGQLEDAQRLLSRLEQDYTAAEVASIATWNAKFLELAQEKREEAVAAREAGRWREARRLALDSLYLYPEIPGGKELVREIDIAYPLVNVGVLQSATVLDPTRIDNWPARRTGRLVYRSLFEMQDAGSEGGVYTFVFGDSIQSPDRMELLLELHPERLQGPLTRVDAYDVADRLTALALRDSSEYSPAWAAVLRAIAVPTPKATNIFLRRPHVLPQSLLQIKVDGSWAGLPEGSPTGAYAPATEPAEEGVARFLLSEEYASEDRRPREIVEIHQDDAAEAVESLLRGDLDVMDHLFPADASRLRNHPGIVVGDYPLPTVHMLVPVSDHPYLAERTFRRALVYGIDRANVLNGELLGNTSVPGCQVVSGPFPAGTSHDDPLAYAYDRNILPRDYQPRLAMLLKTMTAERLAAEAEQDKTTAPELTPLRLGHPQDDMARIACHAIAQQLNMIGIPVELVELPPGISRPDPGVCDLVYMAVAVWEPISDARRVLGPDGLAASHDQLIGLGLRRLESAKNWREVRERLLDLHSITYNELPIIPLWQLVDSYAYREDLVGMGSDIVSLYQNVDRWRLNR